MAVRSKRVKIEKNAVSDAAETARIKGFVEVIKTNVVAGWAWNAQAPEERLEIEILLGETSLGKIQADRIRPDLEENGIGDGKYAFRFLVEDPLSDADQDRVVALARRDSSDEPVRLPWVVQQAQLVRTLVESQREFTDSVATIHRSQIEALDAQKTMVKLHAEIVELLQGERGERETEERRLRELQEGLEQRLATLEVVQTRFDTALLNLSKLGTEISAARKSGPAWLTGIAVLLAMGLSGVLGFFLGQHWS